VPVTDDLTAEEIAGEYEKNTGLAICRKFKSLDPEAIRAVLVAGHAPFCWGTSATSAAYNAVVLEYIAKMAYYTISISPDAIPLKSELHDKHYLRKHGRTAYYGQVPNS
jgi:L-ribulose-5-phosphate 4-epimerase